MIEKNKRWGIIGGGFLGITLSYRLAQKGYSATLFEAASEIGGLAGACKLGDITWDRFYHVILKSDSYLRTMLKEIGLEEKINWVETKTGFYSDGKFYSMSGILEFLKFPPINIIDKIRLGITILYASYEKNWRKLERIPINRWLERWSGKNTYEKIWKPLLRAKLGESYKETSAAFIWATIQRMYAARRNGIQKEMFGYIPGGYRVVLKKILDIIIDNKVCVKLNHAVKKIHVMPSGEIAVEFVNGNTEYFDEVIATLPSNHLTKICPSLTIEERKRHNAINYLGVICVSILMKKPLSRFYITNITDAGYPFTGIIEMTALVDRKEFKGNNLIYLPKYISSESSDFIIPDQIIYDEYLNGLKKIYPEINNNDILAWNVSRAKNVFALSTLNYSQQMPPVTCSVKNLHVVNSAYSVNSTANINETIRLAESTLEKIIM